MTVSMSKWWSSTPWAHVTPCPTPRQHVQVLEQHSPGLSSSITKLACPSGGHSPKLMRIYIRDNMPKGRNKVTAQADVASQQSQNVQVVE